MLVADEYVGAVMSDLSGAARPGVGHRAGRHGRTLIRAEVPELEIARYAVELRSMSHGTATFTRAYIGHSRCPAQVAKKVQDQQSASADDPASAGRHNPHSATTRSSELVETSLHAALGTRGAHAHAPPQPGASTSSTTKGRRHAAGLDKLDHQGPATRGRPRQAALDHRAGAGQDCDQAAATRSRVVAEELGHGLRAADDGQEVRDAAPARHRRAGAGGRRSRREAENKAVIDKLAAWEKANGTKVNLTIMNGPDLITKLIAAMQVGDVPDLVHSVTGDRFLVPRAAWDDQLGGCDRRH